MNVIEIAAGVTLGIILAAAFLWCCRALNVKDDRDAPWWAIGGFLFIMAFIGLSAYPTMEPPLSQRNGTTAAEYLQAIPAPAD